MKADLKAKWIAALRSGDYRQAAGSLRQPEGHCCLGVLCEVAGLPRDTPESGFRFDGKRCGMFAPSELGVSDFAETLMTMNDSSAPRHSFKQIADYIEQHIPAEVA